MLAPATAFFLLGACTAYHPLPLEERASLAAGIEALAVDPAVFPGGAAGRRAFEPRDGLDLDEVGILAAVNNPDLRAQRASLAVAEAQVFAAGLLPDPQINAAVDNPTGDSGALVDGWSVGIGYDIMPLITRQANIDAASGASRKVHLDLLWQEWQVVQKARSLAVALSLEGEQLALLQRMLDLYLARYQHSAVALEQGDVPLDVNGTDLTALVDTLSQINQLEQTHNQTRHDLNALLGLEPRVSIDLAPLPSEVPVTPDLQQEELLGLAQRRPDLLALQAGYASQEARVRAAILAQFPSLGIELHRARDTGDVKTTGLGVSLNLPLLSGNRGAIATERASRAQLHEEYRARLAQTVADVDRLHELQEIIRRQQAALGTYLPRLEVLVERSRSAYANGDIDALAFLNMESTWVSKSLEQISLAQAGWENRIALEALLAMPGYPVEPPLRNNGTERPPP